MGDEQPAVRVREVTLRSPDPQGMAALFESVLGMTKLREDEHQGNAAVILTDGYVQLAITSKEAPVGEDGEAAAPSIDHIGIQVADLEGTCEALTDEGWSEPSYSQPATRFLEGPEGLELEIREPGWGYDDVIRAGAQLWTLAPADDGRPAPVQLPEVRTDDEADADGFVRVGRIDSLAPGGAARVEVDGTAVCIVDYEGEYHAVQDACPHLPRFGRVSEGQRDGCVLECPIHRSRFDLTDGHVIDPPARRGLKRFDVALRGDDILVRVR